MSVWKEYKLKDVVSFIDYRGKTPNKKTFGVPLITAKIVKNGVIQEPTEFISFEDYKGWMTRGFPMVGDVVMTTEAPLGEVAQIKDASFALAQRIITMRGKDGLLHSGYLKYFLQSNIGQARLKERETGTTVTGIKSSELKEVLVSAPDYKTQTAIAEILSSLDDKIELNNKINQELENLAQTLFKQWFIDFEFPNENGEPYKSSGGEMVDSELGEIPKGWEVKQLKDFVNCYDNKRVPLSSRERAIRKGSYPYYGAASLMDYVDDYLFDGIYVLMGEDGSVTDANGYPVLQYVFGQFWVNNHAHVLQGTTISTELVMCLLKNTNISHLVTGAVQPKLNQGNMNKISLAIPNDLNILNSLEMNIKSIYESVRNNTQENQELTLLRDTLLPKLISGELEVADIMAEKA